LNGLRALDVLREEGVVAASTEVEETKVTKNALSAVKEVTLQETADTTDEEVLTEAEAAVAEEAAAEVQEEIAEDLVAVLVKTPENAVLLAHAAVKEAENDLVAQRRIAAGPEANPPSRRRPVVPAGHDQDLALAAPAPREESALPAPPPPIRTRETMATAMPLLDKIKTKSSMYVCSPLALCVPHLFNNGGGLSLASLSRFFQIFRTFKAEYFTTCSL